MWPGGMKCQLVPSLLRGSAKSLESELLEWLCKARSSLVAPTKVVPQSEYKSVQGPLRERNRLNAARKASVVRADPYENLHEAGVRHTIEEKILAPGRRLFRKSLLSEAGVGHTIEEKILAPGPGVGHNIEEKILASGRRLFRKSLLSEAGVEHTIEEKILAPGRRPSIQEIFINGF
ncbi:hypothetical protein FF38_01735 [Lucilia cuprina]|uniref:Uncharacterized protein n=1 Tax=Lucilia cuprina TaxID=7375 RepID=A0A0L0C7U3_LUCCU|nr:hypothetical protein FF38_01735 [Lucilia cuprina]